MNTGVELSLTQSVCKRLVNFATVAMKAQFLRIVVKGSNMSRKFRAKYHLDRRNLGVQKTTHSMSEAERKGEYRPRLKVSPENRNSLQCVVEAEILQI